MKNLLVRTVALVIALAGGVIGPVSAQPSVGVSIDINQPGVYGRINIGNYPPPPLVYAQPVIIVPGPVAVQRAPIYLYVPATHQQSWSRYCGRYGACGQPVYFVQERWVQERREVQREHAHPVRKHDRDHGWDKHERRDKKERGHGKGHGRDRDD